MKTTQPSPNNFFLPTFVRSAVVVVVVSTVGDRRLVADALDVVEREDGGHRPKLGVHRCSHGIRKSQFSADQKSLVIKFQG